MVEVGGDQRVAGVDHAVAVAILVQAHGDVGDAGVAGVEGAADVLVVEHLVADGAGAARLVAEVGAQVDLIASPGS